MVTTRKIQQIELLNILWHNIALSDATNKVSASPDPTEVGFQQHALQQASVLPQP
jgi:hypothetical protein